MKQSFVTVARDQKRAVVLACMMAAASLWVAIPLGRWQVGVFLSAGFMLGLVNHIATELSLKRSVDSGEAMSRTQFASSAFFRLMGVSLVAVALTIAFWREGGATLFGLAIFRLIALVLTGLPLLRELKKA